MINILPILLFFCIPNLIFSQDCEAQLQVVQETLEECSELLEDCEGIIIDGITEEETSELVDFLFGERNNLIEQRNEEKILRIVAESKLDSLITFYVRLDSLVKSLQDGTAILRVKDIEMSGTIKPYQNE